VTDRQSTRPEGRESRGPVKQESQRAPTAVRALGQLAATEWRLLLAASTSLLVASGAMLLYPRGIKLVLDRAVEAQTPPELTGLCLRMLALAAVIGVGVGGRQFLFGIAAERLLKRLRQRLYERLLDQDLAFFDRHQTGDLLNRLTVDVNTIRVALTSQVGTVARNAALAIGGVTLLVYTAPVLGGATVLAISALIALFGFLARRASRLARRAQAAFGNASSIAQEALSGIRTVRAFSAEAFERQRYDHALDIAAAAARRGQQIGEKLRALTAFTTYGASVLLLWAGGRLVIEGKMTVGDLSSFFAYSLILAVSINALGEAGGSLVQVVAAAERVFAVIHRTPTVQSGGLRPADARGTLELRDVRFAFERGGGRVCVSVDHLCVAAGEMIALVGPSGAGKSTLAALVAHFYDPAQGSVMFDGHDLRDLDDQWLKEHISIVPQQVVLFSATIAENIAYGRPGACDDAIVAAARLAGAHDFIAALPEGYRSHIRATQLSGGERQRIAIARALLRAPKLLILDEATAALDSENERVVQKVIEMIAGKVSVIIISHRLSTIAMADRILVMDAGSIVQEGTHADLISRRGLYRRLLTSHRDGHVVPERSSGNLENSL